MSKLEIYLQIYVHFERFLHVNLSRETWAQQKMAKNMFSSSLLKRKNKNYGCKNMDMKKANNNKLFSWFSFFLSGNMPFFVSIFIVQKQIKTISFDTKVLFRISCNLSLNPIIIAFILREICIFRRQMKVHLTNGFGSDPKML